MAQIIVQKSLDGTTTKSILNITESSRTSAGTTFSLNIKTNFVYSAGYIGIGESLQGIVSISGSGMEPQAKTIILKSTSDNWSGTTVHTKNDNFDVNIPSTVTNITVTYTLKHNPSSDSVSGNTSMILTKMISQLNRFENNVKMNLEESQILSITQYDDNYINNLVLYFKDSVGELTELGNWDNVVDSQEIQLTEKQLNTLYDLTPNNKWYNLIWRLSTFNDDQDMGYMELESAGLISNANPIFEDFSYEDSNINTNGLTGDNQSIIGGFSTLKIFISPKATAQKGAKIVSYLIADTSVLETENEISIEIANYNLNEIVVSAIDSRGNSTKVTKQISNFINYSVIQVEDTNATIERVNGSDEETKVSFKGTFWNNNFGSKVNSLKINYKYRDAGSTGEYVYGTTTINPDIVESLFSVIEQSVLGDTDIGFDTSKSYEIVIGIEDELSINEIEYRLDPGVDAIVIEGNKVLEINGVKYIPLTDSGYIALELTEDFKPYDDKEDNIPHYKKIGKMVQISGVISPVNDTNNLNSATETIICILPEEIRPQFDINLIFQGSGTNIWLASIKTNGELNACRYRNSSSYSTTSPGVTTWMPFHIVYFLD